MIVLAIKIYHETSDLHCTSTYISAEGKNDVSGFVFSGPWTHKGSSTHSHIVH